MLQRRKASQDEILLQRQLRGNKISSQFFSMIFQYTDVSFNNFEFSPNSKINWIDLENIENRFLLSSYGDGSIMIFDLFKRFDKHLYKNLAKIDRTVLGSHKMSVDCVQWYPHDTGMFVSAGADQTVRIWDTNELQVAYKFEFQHKISNFDISLSHALVSVTSKDSNVYLCDLKNGSRTHTIKGHRSSSLLTKWSPRNQNVLVSTSVLGEVYLWDIRKANSLLMKFSNGIKDAHNGAVNGLCFAQGGLYLITLSTDETVGLWDFSNGTLAQTRYGSVVNDSCQPLRLSVTNCLQKDVVFVPSQETIKVFEIHTGKCTKTLSAHLMKTTSCDFNNDAMILYSGSADTKILEWSYQKTTDYREETADQWEE